MYHESVRGRSLEPALRNSVVGFQTRRTNLHTKPALLCSHISFFWAVKERGHKLASSVLFQLSLSYHHHRLSRSSVRLLLVEMASKPPSTAPSLGSDLVRRSLHLPFGVAAVYLTFFLALLTPAFQRHFIFLHAIRFPFFPSFDRPEAYGIAPFKTRPLTLNTSDGERIGAWHVLPEIFYQSQLSAGASEWGEEVYARAMREYPTILYLHGNSMNRAAPWRIGAYSALTSRIDANVVAIDYRGFGDSSGTPSENGLVLDAEAAYRWIRSQQDGAPERMMATLFGQSLGTGIAALLAEKLERSNEPVDGVVLMAPYTDLKSLVKDFRLGGMLPLLAPIDWIPFNNCKLPPIRILGITVLSHCSID